MWDAPVSHLLELISRAVFGDGSRRGDALRGPAWPCAALRGPARPCACAEQVMTDEDEWAGRGGAGRARRSTNNNKWPEPSRAESSPAGRAWILHYYLFVNNLLFTLSSFFRECRH